MRKLKARVLAIPFGLLLVTATFQNCSGGFAYDPKTGNVSNLSSSGGDITGVFGIKAYAAGGSAVADAMPFDPGVAYDIRATGSNVSAALLTWSLDSANSSSCVLNSTGSVNRRELKCTTPGIVTVKLQAIWADETMSYASYRHTVGASVASTPTPVAADNSMVSFRIRAGTGTGAWNAATTPIVVFVGQTLRIYNDDTINHRVHTNGVPFPHQDDNITPNTFRDFAIASTHVASATDLYDHDAGTAARVYLDSVNGMTAYAKVNGPGSCVLCHGALANSEVRGASLTSIRNAIAANRGGMAAITLTANELAAIAYELSK